MDAVTDLTVWRTDDQCPACSAGLVLIGHGQPVQVLECRVCDWSQRWDLTGDNDSDGKAGDAG